MNRADVKALFPDITDEQLKALMDMNGNDVNAAKSAHDEKLKAAEEKAASLQAQVDEFNAKQAQNMTREEQLEAALKEVQAKQVETAKGWNRMTAANAFSGLGLSTDHLEKVLDAVVSEDAEATAAKAAEFASIFKASTEAAVAAHVKSAQTSTQPPQGGVESAAVTKEQFDSMGYMERVALKQESPELYEQLNN